MSIKQNRYFSGPKAIEGIRRELEIFRDVSTPGLTLTGSADKRTGYKVQPEKGVVGVWLERSSKNEKTPWTRVVFYTVHSNGIYVEEITPVAWQNSQVSAHASDWLDAVQEGEKEDCRV